MRTRRLIGNTVAATALLVAGLFAPAVQASTPTEVVSSTTSDGEVGALSCYGGSELFRTNGGASNYAPSSGWYTTSHRCNDINVRGGDAHNRAVRVCFNPSSAPSYCQSSYSSARVGEWTVIAENVLPGTQFRLDFLTSAEAQGWVAS